MSRRRLRPEEKELWQKVAHSTKPLPQALRRAAEPQKPSVRRAPEPEVIDLPKAFGIGTKPPKAKTHITTPDSTTSVKPVMDTKTFGKMKRGKLVPEARIDLHGMTLDQAHPALTAFILKAQADGLRLALVITGKGKATDESWPMPRSRGILRRQVPQWLAMPPLAQAVLQVAPANIRHGGEGAYYVYLRRPR